MPECRSLPSDVRAATTICSDAAGVARASDVIVLMLPDASDVEDILFGSRLAKLSGDP